MRATLAAALFLVLAAQASASPMEHLQAALANNAAYQQSLIGLDIAAESENVAAAELRPQVRSSFSYRLDKPPAMGMGDGPERLNGQIVITQKLFDRGSEGGVDVAREQSNAAALRADAARQGLLLATYRAYLGAALAQEMISLLDKRKAILLEQLNEAEGNVVVGYTNRLQVLGVQAELAALEAEYVSARNGVETAISNLRNLTGGHAGEIRSLARAPDAPEGELSDWSARATDAPEVAAAASDVRVQQELTRQLRGSVLPSAEAAATFDKRLDAALNLNLSVPIYSSGGAQAALRRSTLQESSLGAAYEAALDAKQVDISNSWRSYHQNKALEEALEVSVKVGRERLTLAQESIELVAGVLADALDAEGDLAEAELQLAMARHGQFEAWLTLMASAGALDMGAVTGLEELFE